MFEKKKNFFGRLKENLENVILNKPEIDEAFFDEIEETLILSDIGLETAENIITKLREEVRSERIAEPEKIKTKIVSIVAELLDKGERNRVAEKYPMIILAVGVNGSGKTTTIAKLASHYKGLGKKAVLVAADTFRAAATEQLNIWAKKLELPIVKRTEGEDPGAVIYDAVQYAKEHDVDILICDTAGRLQTKKNLMNELAKLDRIIEKGFPEMVRETLLTLDAGVGKNAVSQAKEFGDITDITGLIITKLDSGAKGGIAITVASEFDLPIKFIGTGERLEDIEAFNPQAFAENIFG